MVNQNNSNNLPALFSGKNLPVIKDNQQLHELVFKVFKPDEYNILLPTAINIDPKVKVQIHILSTTPPVKKGNSDYYDFSNTRDWWSFKNKDTAIPTANLLRKIAATVGIRWNLKYCDVTHIKEDADGRIISLHYKAAGNILLPSGVFKPIEGVYRYNYADDLEDKQYHIYEWRKVNGEKTRVDTGKIDMDTISRRRRFALQLCETGAKKRAIYDGLSVMENTFTIEDTFKPFVIPVVSDDYNEKDPIIRAAIAERALGASSEMFGGNIDKAIDADYEIEPDKGTLGLAADPNDDIEEPPLATEPDDNPPELPLEQKLSKREIYLKDMHDASSDERGDELKRLMNKTNTMGEYSKYGPPDTWKLNIQMAHLNRLAVMAGEIEAAEK